MPEGRPPHIGGNSRRRRCPTRGPRAGRSRRWPEIWHFLEESHLTTLRLRTDAAKRFRKEGAIAVILEMLMVAQKKFRRLNAPELLAKVYAGVQYKDGIEVAREEVAA